LRLIWEIEDTEDVETVKKLRGSDEAIVALKPLISTSGSNFSKSRINLSKAYFAMGIGASQLVGRIPGTRSVMQVTSGGLDMC
jgi:hypothetical protein